MSKQKEIQKYNGKKCGRNNTTSKNIAIVLEKLEALEFVSHVSPGNFKPSNVISQIDILGYDDRKKQYILNVYGGQFVQKVLLNVSAPKPEYRGLIKGCSF